MPGFSCSVPGCFQLLPTTLYKEVPPSDVADWIKSKLDCAYFSLIGSSRCQSKCEQSLRLGVRWNSLSKEKGDRENLLRLNFLERFCTIYEHIHQRKLLTPGTNTLQDEEPQVSIEKARSNHHSKLITVVLLYWLSFASIPVSYRWISYVLINDANAMLV